MAKTPALSPKAGDKDGAPKHQITQVLQGTQVLIVLGLIGIAAVSGSGWSLAHGWPMLALSIIVLSVGVSALIFVGRNR